MHVDFAAVWATVLKELAAIYHTLGLGGGALALQLLRFMPAPRENQVFFGWLMDAVWTVAGQSRAGERRTRDGATVQTEKRALVKTNDETPSGIVIQPGG